MENSPVYGPNWGTPFARFCFDGKKSLYYLASFDGRKGEYAIKKYWQNLE